jgi:gamma-glutamyl hercynylcysteine S-oxide synthase
MSATLHLPPQLSAADAEAALTVVRERTSELVRGITDEDLERVHSPIMSPLVWDLGHIAAYEDLWLCQRFAGLELLHPELAGAYDAFETPRAERGEVELLDRRQAEEYLDAVRVRAVDALRANGVGDGLLHELVIRHEAQHNETMLQTLALARLDYHRPAAPAPAAASAAPAPATPTPSGLDLIDVPGARFPLGAEGAGFAYDNERPSHEVTVGGFRLGRVPVTNRDWLQFVRDGGYRRAESWSPEGWAWRCEEQIEHPGGWVVRGGPVDSPDTEIREWRMGGERDLALDNPVVHISFHEAEAFACAHGLRLPTEAEWELAATWDHEREVKLRQPWGDAAGPAGRANLIEAGTWGTLAAGSLPAGASPCGALGMLGDVWEWTASSFGGYPGFVAHPYREYSEVFFGAGYRCLRGGSWASSVRVATTTFRNWDLPRRRQIFAGLRLAGDT